MTDDDARARIIAVFAAVEITPDKVFRNARRLHLEVHDPAPDDDEPTLFDGGAR